MIHAGYLNDQAIDGRNLEANQIHHSVGRAPVEAKEIVAIHGG